MKAQLTLEYMISLTLFIGIIIYLYFSYSANIPSFVGEIFKEDARVKAYQLSELLVNDPGEPDDWDQSSVERLGLSDENLNKTNLISEEKITELNGFDCSVLDDYNELKSLFALDREFSIVVFEIEDDGNRNSLFSCFPPFDLKTSIQARVTRITAYTDGGNVKKAEVIVQVW